MIQKMKNTIVFNELLIRNVIGAHGEKGKQWLQELPRLIEDISTQWKLTELVQYTNLSYNFVASAVTEQSLPVVLKLGVPTKELLSEIGTLQLWTSNKAVKLVNFSAERGALLLEKVSPGDPLTVLNNNEEETFIAASLMKELWKPVSREQNFFSLKSWGSALLNAPGNGPLPIEMIQRAQKLFIELLGSSPSPMLLHGDLHHQNIIKGIREPWIVIDPKGIVGDPAYDVAAFLFNPPGVCHNLEIRDILHCRVRIFESVLGFDQQRILSWGYVQALLSACWCVSENKEEWKDNLRIAEVLLDLSKH